jgi:hypothetical protein
MPIINPALDASGNGNNWTPININYFTSGVTYDTMTDVPTNTNTNTANYCVLNPIARGTVTNGTITGGNLNLSTTTSDTRTYGTFGIPSSGKYYWELTNNNSGDKGQGIASVDSNGDTYQVLYFNTGDKRVDGTTSAYGASYTSGDVIGVAVDVDNNQITFYKNNVSQGAISYTFSSKPTLFTFVRREASTDASYSFNFGQRGFLYTPPSGFVALNTFNLPTPTIGATASTQANKYFDATLWTGTGATLSLTNSGSMQPDLVWAKTRSAVSSNLLYDSIRGVNQFLSSNQTAAEATLANSLTAFNSNGFTVGSDSNINGNGVTNVAWQWRASNATAVSNTAGSITSTVSANTSAGFSIVTFTAPASGTCSVGHGLGVKPSMVIVKSRSVSNGWFVWHQALGDNNTDYLELYNTSAEQSYSTMWGTVGRTSTLLGFTQGGTLQANATHVAYAFSEVAGYSKFGSYTGNGSSDGPFVFTGFRPKYIMWKNASAVTGWGIRDTSRNPVNVANLELAANSSDAEVAGQGIDILSNGFKLRTADSWYNGNGNTMIFMAFSETPFNYSNAR